MSPKTKICLLFLPIGACVLFLGYRGIHWKILGFKSAQVQKKLELDWSHSPFISLSNNRSYVHDEILSKLQTELPMASGVQLDALSDSLVHLLLANSTGSVSEYEQFRFPVEDAKIPTFWNIDWMKSKQDLIRAAGASPVFGDQPTNATSGELVALSKQLFEIAGSLTNKAGQFVFCTHCWTDISVERLGAQAVSSGKAKSALEEWVSKDGNINLTRPTPSVIYRVQDIPANAGTVTDVLVRVIVRTKDSHATYPIYIHLYWDSDYGRWLPMEMLVPTILGFAGSILF